MQKKAYDVIGFGDPFQDLVIRLSQLPPTNVNMRMDDYCFQGGGNMSTAMVASARLGLKSAGKTGKTSENPVDNRPKCDRISQ